MPENQSESQSESQMVQKSLFVYGPFIMGESKAHLLESYVVSRVPARLMATAYRLPIGYPALLFEDEFAEGASRQWVSGEFLTLNAPDLVYKLLDEFHGLSPLEPSKGVYQRRTVKIIVAQDNILEAEVYLINSHKLPSDSELIADGNWQMNLEQRPTLQSVLHERHKDFLKKLGATKGRQVIPYDLNLSRDLMKMDLIVDKGRRLALSKLGKELVKYLP